MIAQSVTDILRDHVKLSAGRASTGRISMFMCLGCKTEQGIVWFVCQHRGQPHPVHGADGSDEPQLRGGALRLRRTAACPSRAISKGTAQRRGDDQEARHPWRAKRRLRCLSGGALLFTNAPAS